MKRLTLCSLGFTLLLGGCADQAGQTDASADEGIDSGNETGDDDDDDDDAGDDDDDAGDDDDDATTGGTTGGEEGPIRFELDCEAPAVGEPVLRLLTREEFSNTISDIFPEIAGQWQNAMPANVVSGAGFDNSATTALGNQSAEKLLETAESVGDALTGPALANLLPCSTSAADAACASEFIAKYGRRLFRRPLRAEEQQRYASFFESALSKADFATALKWVVVGLIQSPNAVYRSEIGTDMGSGSRQLTPHEIATELSYIYTSSTPSEALLSAADAGSVGDLDTLVHEMLATERGKAALQRFFEGYLAYTSVTSVGRAGIPEFANVRADMVRETRAFIDTVVFQQQGGLRELLTTPSTNPSQTLAQYYGLPAPSSDFMSVERPAGQGVGMLAQGSFLVTHASSDGSSPTRRGLYPYTRLLCQPKPPLPDDVPSLMPVEVGAQTTRQRYEDIHTQSGTTCATCHRLFDPIGFAFEHFDEGGRYRQTEAGLPIDATGNVLNGYFEELFSFDGQEALMFGLAEQSMVYQCFSAYMATFAFGTTTSCLAPSRAGDLEAGSIGVAELFAAIAQEPHFTTRRMP